MRKLLVSSITVTILLFISVFFINPIKVLAAVSTSNYEITDIEEVAGTKDILIKGWGLLFNADHTQYSHPTYTLSFYDGSKLVKQVSTSGSVHEDGYVPSKEGGAVVRHDLTCFLFSNRAEGNKCFDLQDGDENVERNEYVKGFADEYIYTYTGFVFRVTIDDKIFDALPCSGSTKIPVTKYTMKLTIAHSSTVTENVNIYKGRVSDAKGDIIVLSDLAETATIVAENAFVQATAKYGSNRKMSDGNYLFYKNYYEYGIDKLKFDGPMTYYGLTMTHYSSDGARYRVDYDTSGFEIKGEKLGYAPAVWVNVTGVAAGGTSFVVVNNDCTECTVDPKCNPLTNNCPTDCCEEICDPIKHPENVSKEFCTSTKYCKADPCDSIVDPAARACCKNPAVCPKDGGSCDGITDPMKKYCCIYPGDTICDDIDDPSDDASSGRNGNCADEKTEEFKYPVSGWDTTNELNNTACDVGCQENLKINFQASRSIRAGMGFTYPVAVDGSRLCTAAYKNESWINKMDTAVDTAQVKYDDMTNYIDEADRLDNICGVKTESYIANNCTGSWSLVGGSCKMTGSPSCSAYEDSDTSCTLSGSTCSCTTTVPEVCVPATCPKSDPKCKQTCTPEHTVPSSGDACSGWDGYDGSSCYDTKSACNSDRSLVGSQCFKYVCGSSGADWNSAQSAIGGQISRADSSRSAYESQLAIIASLNKDRSDCDNWISNNPYLRTPAINASVKKLEEYQNSYSLTNSKYIDKNPAFASGRQYTSKNYTLTACKNGLYTPPSLVGDYRSSASSFSGWYCSSESSSRVAYRDVWFEESTANLTYHFANLYYVQRYTGEVTTDSTQPGYDPHGRYFYTDFYAMSEQKDFSLTVLSLGPNISTVPKTWRINPYNCTYNVTNMIFPQKGDTQYNLYGNVGFYYRQVNLKDMFPNNRTPGENWTGPEKTIVLSDIIRNGYGIYQNTPLYSMTLTPLAMFEIRRDYNQFYPYTFINQNDPYISEFLNRYRDRINLVKRQ